MPRSPIKSFIRSKNPTQMAEPAVTAIWGNHVKCSWRALRAPAGCLHTLDDHMTRARMIRPTSMYM